MIEEPERGGDKCSLTTGGETALCYQWHEPLKQCGAVLPRLNLRYWCETGWGGVWGEGRRDDLKLGSLASGAQTASLVLTEANRLFTQRGRKITGKHGFVLFFFLVVCVFFLLISATEHDEAS